MKTFTLVSDDSLISIDGQSLLVPFVLSDSNIHSVFFDFELKEGEIDFKDSTLNQTIDNIDSFLELIDLYNLEKKKNNPPSQFHVWDESSKLFIEDTALRDEYRVSEILNELNQLDIKSVRPLREGDIDRINDIESQAQILRDELRILNGS